MARAARGYASTHSPRRTNAMAGLVDYYFHGYIVARYLAAVDSEARAAYRLRYPDKPGT